MTNNEALQAAEKACNECLKNKGMCTEENRASCWIYNAKTALFYRTMMSLTEMYTDGELKGFQCSHCGRRIKNDKHIKFCPRCGKAIDWGNE